jgi:hypothetical protein
MAWVELTRRLISTASCLTKAEARTQAVLKIFVLFMNEYVCAAEEKRGKSLAAGLLES